MSIKQKYQLAIQFRSLINVNLKQSCFLQIRCGVGQERKNKDNVFAQCYQIIQNPPTQSDKKIEEGEILNDGSYLSQKLFFRHNSKDLQVNSTCIFKGEIQLSDSQYDTEQIFISCQLNWLQAEEVQVISEWEGYLKFHTVNSALEIFFPSHLFSCYADANVHCILTSIQIQKQEQISASKPRLYYNTIQKKMTHLYDAALDPIIASKQELQNWMFLLKHEKTQSSKSSFKYGKFQKLYKLPKITTEQKQKFASEMKQLKNAECIEHLKDDSHELAISLYPIWKQLIALLQKNMKHFYFEKLRSQYHKYWNKERWLNKIQIYSQKQTIQQIHEQPGELQILSYEKNDCKVRLNIQDYEAFQSLEIPSKKPKVLILVHGFQASSYDMQIIALYFQLKNPNLFCFISQNNEGRTEGPIQQLGHRLAVQVKNYINTKGLKDMEISFLGHSLGGIIIRASLKYLQLYKDKFKSFITLCSPHLSYLHHTSKLVTTSLWVMNKLKKDQSMIELTMQDSPQLNKTYLYDLCNRKQLNWFENIILLGSKEDEYVPYASALLQSKQFFLKTQQSKVYEQLYSNFIKNIENKIIRIQLVYNDKIKDISSFIGRTGHIKPLSYLPVIDLYTFLISKKL